MSVAAPLDEAVGSLLGVLEGFLPQPSGGPLPESTVQLATFTQREVGLGRWRGVERAADLAVVTLKGVRLDAIARYRVWAAEANDVSAAAGQVQRDVLASREALRAAGVLDLKAHEMGGPAFESGLPGWYATVEFQVLFEFHYRDDDGADSVIARIPIDVDREHLEVTDAMVRWDALEAPDLLVGKAEMTQVGHLSVLALFPPAWLGAPVVLAVQQGGVRRQQVFADVIAFVAALTPGEPLLLGGQTYVSGTLVFPTEELPGPLELRRSGDFLQVSYAAASFDDAAVLYIRAQP